MGRITLPKASIQAQLVAVRRAASTAALAAKSDGKLKSLRSKAETHRDALAAAAVTLAAVQASREALDCMPDHQRDQMAIRLAALGFRAERIDRAADMPAVQPFFQTRADHV